MTKTSWRVTTCLLMTVWAAYPLVAQQPASSVMAGAKLRVEFMSEVSTAVSRTNEGVQVRLIKPVDGEALPTGTVLSGRVLDFRKGDKHTKSYPMIRLGFNRATLPDGRSFPVEASLADLRITEYVDSEGAATSRTPR